MASPRPPQLWVQLSEPLGPRGYGLRRQNSAQHSATPNSETHHWTSKACARTVQRLSRPSSELRWDRAGQPWATPGHRPDMPPAAPVAPPTRLHERGQVGGQPVGPRAGEALQLGLWRDFIAVKGVIFLLRVQLSQPAGTHQTHTGPAGPREGGSASASLRGQVWPMPAFTHPIRWSPGIRPRLEYSRGCGDPCPQEADLRVGNTERTHIGLIPTGNWRQRPQDFAWTAVSQASTC